MNQFENAEFDKWIAEYRVENNLSHVINDPDLQMYSKYDEARRDRQEAKRFLEELESDYFDESGNVLIGESYLPVVFYTQLVEDEVTNLRYQVFDLEDLEDLLLALPATATSMSIEDINGQLETIPATNTELRSVLSEAKRAREYMTEFSVESLEEVQEMLADKRKVYDETNSRFESSIRYLYSVMPNSTKVVNYMYQIDGNNPEVAYMYNENSYNMNVRPLLENPALLDSYLQYYSQYFGAQARSLLIDSPIQSIEGDLNRKVINSTEAATDLKISALYLLVDIYEKMANLEQNEPLMEIYLMAEKHYLEKLLEFNPEDETIRSLIETIEFYISELNASQTIDATETADSTEFETSSDIDFDTEVTPGELSVPFEIEAPSQIGDVDLDVSLDSEGPNETNN